MTLPPDADHANQPLEYAPPRRGRPGILTAVGIISIIVGLLSALMNLGSVLSGFGLLMMLRASTIAVQPRPRVAPLAVPSATTCNQVLNFVMPSLSRHLLRDDRDPSTSSG